MIRFGIVGSGWRTGVYLRVARAFPDRFRVVGMVARNPAKAASLAERFGMPLYASVDDLAAAARPMFVVTSVPPTVNPGVIRQLATLVIPVLSETPPATTIEELAELWSLARQGAKIQVAEQYWLQPNHAARLAFARSGRIGQPSQVEVSAAHGYHGISLMRRYLGIGSENATITARSFTFPIVQGPGRFGPPSQETIIHSSRLIAFFEFGDRLGLFDFSGDQYFSPVRDRHVRVRGPRGEIGNESAVYLHDFLTPIRVTFVRHSASLLEGNYLRGIQAGAEWLYRNPLAPGELVDDELIAVGTCLLKMAEYVEGGDAFYSLAEACQDRYLDLMTQEAVSKGQLVVTQTQVWSD